MADAFDASGAATGVREGDPLHPDALDAARKATFTQPLGEGTWGATLQQAVQRHPLAQLALPFVKIPTNLTRWAWYRTPGFNQLHSQWRQEWDAAASDPMKRSEMMGQMVTGSMLWLSAMGLAANGRVTGGGPADPGQKQMLMASGWRPYSFVTFNPDGTKNYTGFKRLDPTGTFFGIAADMHELYAMARYRPDDEFYTSAAQAVGNTLKDKAYLEGISGMIDALSDTDNGMQKFLNQFAGSMVPAIVNPSQWYGTDPLRTHRTMLDAVRARTPGLAQGLDPQRNLLGSVVYPTSAWGPDFASPVPRSSEKEAGGGLERRLFNLSFMTNDKLAMPPTHLGQTDLRDVKNDKGQSAYDRQLELLSASPVRNMLTSTLDSLKDQRPDLQMQAVRGILGNMRSLSYQQMLQEFPQLRMADIQQREVKAGAVDNPLITRNQ
jgi:hypothetical protein